MMILRFTNLVICGNGYGAGCITKSTWQSPSWEVNSTQTVKELPTFYGTWRFIIVFTSACLSSPR